MPQNITQYTATGTFSDTTQQDITTQGTTNWTISDTSIATVGGPGFGGGQVTIQNAGKIWGATVGITATQGAIVGTGSILVIASDSGSVAPRMPQFDDHWVALGVSPWQTYWGCQEPTGNLAGSGSVPLTLTAIGAVTYLGVTPGFIRDALVSVSGGAASSGFTMASGTGPNCRDVSWGMLAYGTFNQTTPSTPLMGLVPATSGDRLYMGSNGGSAFGAPSITTAADQKNATGPNNVYHGDRVHPFLILCNRTTQETWIATDEVIAMSASVPTSANDGAKGWGTESTHRIASASLTYFAIATGSIVEGLCSVSASADFLSRLGWSVAWKNTPTDSGTIKLPFLVDHYKALGLKPWTATWNCQEPNNNPYSFDMVKGYNSEFWTAIHNGTATYLNGVPGWIRKSIGITQVANVRFSVGGNWGPPILFDPTGSFASLVYVSGNVVAATARPITGVGASQTSTAVLSTYGAAGVPIVYCAGATVTGTQTILDNRFHPWLLVYDKTNSRVKLYTDLEKITGSFVQINPVANGTGSFWIGALSTSGFTTPAAFFFNYAAFTTGTLAETLSDDGVASAYLKTLGWNPPW